MPIAGVEKVFDGRAAVYRNPRALPRAYVVDRYRAFSSGSEMLDWIKSPLLDARSCVLLRETDLGKIPEPLRAGLENDEDGLRPRIVGFRTGGEKRSATVEDPRERWRLEVLRPPWGWTSGDEVTVALRPAESVPHCWVGIDYHTEGLRPARLTLGLETTGGAKRAIPLELPAPEVARALESPGRISVDIGPLPAGETRIHVEKTEECTARLERVDVHAVGPRPPQPAPARLLRYEPNRIVAAARAGGPALLVVSDVDYPGWRASVDGRAAPILRANYVLRAIPIPAGDHTVTLTFFPTTFAAGAAVSLISVLAVALFLITRRS